MKIYNEVTIDMNPESFNYGNHLSEDSFNYSGELELCCWGDPDPTPWRFAEGLPGDKLPQQTSATFQPDPRWAGYSPNISSPFKGTPGEYEDAYVAAGEGYEVEAATEYNKQFKEGWYDPMFESFVRAPIAEKYGRTGGSYEGAERIDPSKSEFVSAADVFQTAGLGSTSDPSSIASKLLSEGMGSVGQYHGLVGAGTSPLIAKDLRTDVISKGQQLGMKEAAYQTELTDIETAEIESEKTKKGELLGHRVARQEALAGRAPEYEAAKAPMATSGMAYSAPAAAEYGIAREEGIAELSDIARGQAETMTDFRKRKAGFESDISEAETRIGGERSLFGTDLSGILQQSAGIASDILSSAKAVPTAWRDWGGTMGDVAGGSRNIVGKTKWQEQSPYTDPYWGEYEVPEIEELGGLTDEIQRASESMSYALESDLFSEGRGV